MRHWNEDPNQVKVAIYARVSTEDQDCAIQLDDLRGYVQRSGWVATEYVEKLSGKEGVRRPQLEKLMADARQKRFDVVLVWKLDRFGRSTLDTLQNVRDLDRHGVRFLCPQMNIDTSDKSPFGKFMLGIFALIAELERSFILERTAAGFKAYQVNFDKGVIGKTKHSKSGKDLPVGRPRCIVDRKRALELHRSGSSIRQIASALKVSPATAHRLVSQKPV